MVYKYHKFIREELGPEDSSYWYDDQNPALAKRIRNLRRDKPIIPYTLEIECNSYWGNFEREFVAYSIGVLDDVQHGRHSEEELEMFWQEVFKTTPPTFEEALVHYAPLRDYLLETFQDVDDWSQLTFYRIDWNAMHKEGREVLCIQLAKPFGKYWEDIIIPRMKDFFNKKIYEWMHDDTELISIKLYNRAGNLVKEY